MHHLIQFIAIFLCLITFDVQAKISFFEKAQRVTKSGHFFEAIKWYELAIKKNPRNFVALNAQAQLYFKVGNKKMAVATMNKSLKLNPFHVESNFNMGIILVGLGKFKRGLKYLEVSKKLRPKLFEIYPHMAEAYGKIGEITKAKIAFHTMIELRPKIPWIHREYARYLDKIGHYEFAKEQYKEAANMLIHDYEYRYEYALFLKNKMKQNEEALAQFKKVLFYKDDHLMARYEMARIYEKEKQYILAKKNYKILIKKFPKFIRGYIRMGVILRHENKLTESLSFFSRGLKLDPKNIKALEEKALIFVTMKKYDKAAKEYFLLTTFYPKYPKPYIFRGWLFELIGRTDKAEKEYNMAIGLDKMNIEARLYLGMMYNTSENYEAAKKVFQEIINIDKENDNARFYLAEIYYKNNQYELAGYHYNKLSAQSQFYEKSRLAREQVNEYLEREKSVFKRFPSSQ